MKIFAHRGASIEAPENSPQSVRRALEIEVDGIEIDCVMTQDSVPVVNHDDNLLLQRKAKGCVRNKTWKEVKALAIPSLTEILEIIKPSSAMVILDIKTQRGWMEKGPLIIAGLALEILPPERILVSSFSFRHLLALKKGFPSLARGLILGSGVFKLVPPRIFDRLLAPHSIHLGLWSLKKRQVRKWKGLGLKVHAWVANREEEFKKCVELDVDGVFTDDPRLAKEILKNG